MTAASPVICDWSSIPDRLKLPYEFDAGLLARDLARLNRDDWIEHFLTDRYIGNWDVLPLRAPENVRHPILMIAATQTTQLFEDAPALSCCPYFREVIGAFDAPVRGARLLRLTPGSRLKEHTDHEDTAKDSILRVHIPVVTNLSVTFLLNGSRVAMEAGSAWYLRLCDPHSVMNGGDTDRVHLLVDLVMNDSLAVMLNETAAHRKKLVVGERGFEPPAPSSRS